MFNFLDTSTLIYRVPALLIALTLHEYAHAYVSSSLGDPTPERQGRLTMNPLAHLDVFGTLMLVLCGFGWAKPVEIEPSYYRNYKSGVMKVSVAGPGMNLFIGFIGVLMMSVLIEMGFHRGGGGAEFLEWLVMYNVWFAFFNLIPVPPLDGSKLLEMVLPPKMAFSFHNVSAQYSFVILMLLVFSGVIGRVLTPIAYGYVRLCARLIGLVLG